MFFDLLAPVYNRIIGTREPIEIIKVLGLNGHKDSNQGNLNIMEVGGGTGRFAQHFLKYFDKIWIVDPSIPMLKEAKEHSTIFKTKFGYANDLPFESDTFDLILIYDSLHHWKNQMESMEEINRVLKKDGKLMIAEIHPKRRAGHYIVSMEKLFMMGSHFFTPKELKSLLSNSGFGDMSFHWAKKPTYFVIAKK